MKLALNCLNYKYACAIFDFGNHCIVGAESAEATLRLPPTGYREKIWDHVAGDLFVPDLHGQPLQYTCE